MGEATLPFRCPIYDFCRCRIMFLREWVHLQLFSIQIPSKHKKQSNWIDTVVVECPLPYTLSLCVKSPSVRLLKKKNNIKCGSIEVGSQENRVHVYWHATYLQHAGWYRTTLYLSKYNRTCAERISLISDDAFILHKLSVSIPFCRFLFFPFRYHRTYSINWNMPVYASYTVWNARMQRLHWFSRHFSFFAHTIHGLHGTV